MPEGKAPAFTPRCSIKLQFPPPVILLNRLRFSLIFPPFVLYLLRYLTPLILKLRYVLGSERKLCNICQKSLSGSRLPPGGIILPSTTAKSLKLHGIIRFRLRPVSPGLLKRRLKNTAHMKDKPLTIVEHLSELRRRVVYCLLSVAVTSGAAYAFVDEILEFVMDAGKVENLVFISPMEAFFVIVKLSILAGIVAAMPFIMYQIWRYVGIALREQERKYLIFFGPVSYLLFLCGSALAFRGVLPLAIKFLLSFSRQNITPLITLDSYISFLGKMITAFGLMFQLPLVVLLLAKLGIVSPEFMKKARKYAIVVIFVVAAILTPPDAISQIMLAAPILLLYEVSVWICIVVTRKRERELHLSEPLMGNA